ncbi:L-threonylcarbamoyladenylate synthase [Halalkalibacter urbisdiaboli]|uniref:L-threonylcarbamoyladenylate synthase n=1 Tax=Halalkalibacter urbisdiaboli TaxID=1960589 RepID=UPI000B44B6F0|nr:L-threonylcarbamoyladenylate synthase [Halalkalibacter urbisdiaboli]
MSYKQTKMWTVDNSEDKSRSHAELKEAGLWIKKGEVVAFPTETVYGLGANALDEAAVKKIFAAKGRPSDNPLIVHIANRQQLAELVRDVSAKANMLMDAFWPGPLTLIFHKKAGIAPSVTAGLPTVAVRIPNHPVALAVLAEAGVPVAAPSANLSGKPSPTKAEHVYHDLAGRIAGVVDGGLTGVGVESTVLDCTSDIPVLYRPGGVTKEHIERVIGKIEVDPALHRNDEAPRSPGMKYTHYAPKGELILVEDKSLIQAYVDNEQKRGKKVGVLTTEEAKEDYRADSVIACGKREQLETVATHLYGSLRQFDHEGVDIIFSEIFPEEGVGVAIMNRLSKAAGK